MKEVFFSVKSCLNDLEFCPICGTRNKIDLLLLQDSYKEHITYLDNKQLKATWLDTNQDAFIIDVNDNRVLQNNINANTVPALGIKCKRSHFSCSYHILNRDNIELKAYFSSFILSDKKYNKKYYVMSTYNDRKTLVEISNESSIVDSFNHRLIDFKKFDSKSMTKRIRALNLLR